MTATENLSSHPTEYAEPPRHRADRAETTGENTHQPRHRFNRDADRYKVGARTYTDPAEYVAAARAAGYREWKPTRVGRPFVPRPRPRPYRADTDRLDVGTWVELELTLGHRTTEHTGQVWTEANKPNHVWIALADQHTYVLANRKRGEIAECATTELGRPSHRQAGGRVRPIAGAEQPELVRVAA